MENKDQSQGITNDNILGHFILIGIFLFEIFLKLLNLLIPSKQIKAVGYDKDFKRNRRVIDSQNKFTLSTNLNKISLREVQAIEKHKESLTNKSEVDLRNILENIDLLSNLKKGKLIDLILSNEEATYKFLADEKRLKLNKCNKQELILMLNGLNNLSRLKKSALIELIIEKDIAIPD